MNSQELAKTVGTIVAEAQARITGIGAEQYAQNDQQKFETMDIDDLLIYQEEELLDQINYSVMNLVRIRNIRAALLYFRTQEDHHSALALVHSIAGESKR